MRSNSRRQTRNRPKRRTERQSKPCTCREGIEKSAAKCEHLSECHGQIAGVRMRHRVLQTTRAFSSGGATGSREENASKQESGVPFRFLRNGKGSNALVAQLDRASDFDSEGRRFESFRARHFDVRGHSPTGA